MSSKHNGIGNSVMSGIGVFFTSGKSTGISGSLGCMVVYLYAGLIIIPLIRSPAEMMALRPFTGALLDYLHSFLADTLGPRGQP